MAMAMQSGIGISKILFIAGAGYTGTILFKNGKLSDIIGELQLLVKGLENKSGDQVDGDGEVADAIAAQVRRLANEVRHLSSHRSITVMNAGSGQSNLSSLVGPAAALGAVGYGYMKWKGLSFSSLMYVTKRNMENAVADLTKKLQHASDVIAVGMIFKRVLDRTISLSNMEERFKDRWMEDAKKHLTQRIQNLDDKMRKQNEMARSIKDGVSEVRNTVDNIHDDLSYMQQSVAILDGRLNTLNKNQDLANRGLDYIIDFIRNNTGPNYLPGTFPRDQPKLKGRSPGMITYPGTPNLMGLKDIAESLSSLDRSASDSIVPGGLDMPEQQRRPLRRIEPSRSLIWCYWLIPGCSKRRLLWWETVIGGGYQEKVRLGVGVDGGGGGDDDDGDAAFGHKHNKKREMIGIRC
ncbi:BZIP transcription factor [Trifolium pratense]|uniref:BZIP transcription factor n=1 Tax=Trifolium pratense TaxID=57577 RepID=A0A2K3P646_TRIPR|nr:BZIP transcription factor [Trifolium pratense]